jgi:prepilin-type N-terminal cleavage/methylation domain-containing protein
MIKQNGFTLPELIIAMAIAVVVSMAAYSIFIKSNKTFTAQQDVVEEQQNLRLTMERIMKDVRTAGFGLPDPPFSLSMEGQTFTAPIMDGDATGTNSEDSITILGIGYEVGGTTNAGGVACHDGGFCNNAGASCLCLTAVDSILTSGNTATANRQYISIGGYSFEQVAIGADPRAGFHSAVNKKIELAAPATLISNITTTVPVYIIQAVKYSISTCPSSGSTTVPCLISHDYTGLRGSGDQVFADNIEDMQIAYGLDGSVPPYDRDGKVDDRNLNGVYDNDDYMFSSGTGAILDKTNIIAVRLSLVSKARSQDRETGNVFSRPAVENHAAGAPDKYRRRVLTSVVKLRNPKVPH